MAIDIKRGENRMRAIGFYPDRPVSFGGIIRGSRGAEFGSPGALAGAEAVELPAMISALESAVDDRAHTETHAPMRTAVVQGADLSVFGAEKNNIPTMQTNPNRFRAQFLAGQDGMPVIEQAHDSRPFAQSSEMARSATLYHVLWAAARDSDKPRWQNEPGWL